MNDVKGTFRFAIGKCAFVDRVVMSVYAEEIRRKSLLSSIDRPIFAGSSLYGRCLRGNCRITGNPVTVLHGRISRFPNVPPFRMTMHSEMTPLSGAQVMLCSRAVFSGLNRIRVSSLELTFDFECNNPKQILNESVHRARSWREVRASDGTSTAYIGSPTSAWEVRLYKKRPGVARLEFILRRRMLAAYGIGGPLDIIKLRNADISRLLSLHRYSKRRLTLATSHWNQPAKDCVTEWKDRGLELPILGTLLRANGIRAEQILDQSPRQKRLEAMHRNLIW